MYPYDFFLLTLTRIEQWNKVEQCSTKWLQILYKITGTTVWVLFPEWQKFKRVLCKKRCLDKHWIKRKTLTQENKKQQVILWNTLLWTFTLWIRTLSSCYSKAFKIKLFEYQLNSNHERYLCSSFVGYVCCLCDRVHFIHEKVCNFHIRGRCAYLLGGWNTSSWTEKSFF